MGAVIPKTHRPVEVFLCLRVISQMRVRQRPISVRNGILRIKPDGLVEVLNGRLVLAQAAKGGTPIGVGQGVLGVQAYAWSKSWMAR